MRNNQQLKQREFSAAEMREAKALAERLGYKQTVYTSTGVFVGLQCMKENPEHGRGPSTGGTIIFLEGYGLVFMQDLEDLNAFDIFDREMRRHLHEQKMQFYRRKQTAKAPTGGQTP